jgi:hypothetical protein
MINSMLLSDLARLLCGFVQGAVDVGVRVDGEEVDVLPGRQVQGLNDLAQIALCLLGGVDGEGVFGVFVLRLGDDERAGLHGLVGIFPASSPGFAAQRER